MLSDGGGARWAQDDNLEMRVSEECGPGHKPRVKGELRVFRLPVQQVQRGWPRLGPVSALEGARSKLRLGGDFEGLG